MESDFNVIEGNFLGTDPSGTTGRGNKGACIQIAFGSYNLQNHPVLAAASVTGGMVSIQGSLGSKPSKSYLIEFFANGAGDSIGPIQGRIFLGSTEVATGGAGNAGLSASFPWTSGSHITATATDLVTLDTSEFSPATIIPPPDIAVFEGSGITGAERQDNTGVFTFATTGIGVNSPVQTFTIKNMGSLDLAGLAVTKAPGGSFTDFSVGAPASTTLSAASATTFTITFSPTVLGTRTAILQIASNDPDENPFEIHVTGSAISPLQAWRLTHFGNTASIGDGADNADFDHDGLTNLVEYALWSDPVKSSTDSSPGVFFESGRISLQFFRARADMTYIVESSSDMLTWGHVATNPGEVGTLVIQPDIIANASPRFLRLRVSSP